MSESAPVAITPTPRQKREEGKRAVLITFTDSFQFPPTLHQAAILAERGWRVDLLGLRIPHFDHWEPPDGVRARFFDDVRRGLGLRLQYVAFATWATRWAARCRADLVIGYDMMGAWPAWRAARASGAIFIYHNHDLMPLDAVKPGFYAWVKRAEMKAARAADLVIFPQPQRAKIFKAEARLATDPMIVFNAPRRGWSERASSAPESFTRWRSDFRHAVLYQGQIAKARGLEPLIDAVPHWNFDGGLVIVGRDLEVGASAALVKRAEALGVAERVLVLPSIPHDQLAAVTRLCDVGVGVLNVGERAGSDPSMVNLRYLAGASNKVFEYMAAGLAILSDGGGGFAELLAAPRHGVLCDGAERLSIASALNKLVANPALLETISETNRRAFAEVYNYDAQFQPALDLIEERVRRAPR